MLASYGRDIAGALSFIGDEENIEDEYRYEPISEKEIATKIRESNTTPFLINGKGKLSLAGAQQKQPLFYDGSSWFMPVGSAPSSHIIKPNGKYTLNEFCTTKIASILGIPVPECEMHYFEREPALVSKRYDREIVSDKLVRVHQEDFAQALCVLPENKYEEDGGPGFRSCCNLISLYSKKPIEDTYNFLKVAVFNFIIGNADAHSKNFSFLYRSDNATTLAPFYDLVSSVIYPELSNDMAMKYKNTRAINKIYKDDVLAIGNRKQIKQIIEDIANNLDKAFAYIKSYTDETEEGRNLYTLMRERSLNRLERII